MAHFAEIDENNIVVRVLVVPDSEEKRGQAYLAEDVGLGGTWIQTSYNGKIRKNFASPGCTYDPVNDVFYTQPPYPSWILNEDFQWVAPIPKPDNSPLTIWNEEIVNWENIQTTTPQPYPSWITYGRNVWIAPKPKPGDGYTWNEEILEWEITQ